MHTLSFIFGTRPEAIKLAPLILALRSHPAFDVQVCVTAQHRQMLDQVLRVFDIKADVDLDLMKENQRLAALTSRAVLQLDAYLQESRPDMVLVQGDTTTVFCAALAAFYNHVPVGHVEAGLRTGNLQSPWPEEANRVLATRLTSLHFAPTATSQRNLLGEGVPESDIVVTGNTVIDALLMAREKIQSDGVVADFLPGALQKKLSTSARMILVTGHRRENFGQGFEQICQALRLIAERFPDTELVYPVHLNPRVQTPVRQCLDGIANIHLIKPQDYLPFVWLMDRATIILTDSGGVQEEAPSLGKPVLVMRDTTERPEAVDAGTVRLVGTNTDAIVDGVTTLLTDATIYRRMSRSHNPYGDGHAAQRHVQALEAFFEPAG